RLATGAGSSFCVALARSDAAAGQAGLWVGSVETGRAKAGYEQEGRLRSHQEIGGRRVGTGDVRTGRLTVRRQARYYRRAHAPTPCGSRLLGAQPLETVHRARTGPTHGPSRCTPYVQLGLR